MNGAYRLLPTEQKHGTSLLTFAQYGLMTLAKHICLAFQTQCRYHYVLLNLLCHKPLTRVQLNVGSLTVKCNKIQCCRSACC